MSIVGGVPTPRMVVAIEDYARPFDRIAHAYARRLRARPQFKILRAIVVAHTIAVMYRRVRKSVPAELSFDDEDVLRSRPARPSDNQRTSPTWLGGFTACARSS